MSNKNRKNETGFTNSEVGTLVESLRNDISVIAEDIVSVKNDVSVLKDDMAEVKTRLVTIEDGFRVSMPLLTRRVSALETKARG